jgi:hypothetical protein
MSKLRPTGEEVKAKKEKLLTYACTRARWTQVVKGVRRCAAAEEKQAEF